MAKLKSGTRIYGTATIDTSVVVGSAVTLSSSGIQVTGISTLGTLQVSSGIVTATAGVVTYYGDGSKLTGISASGGISSVSISTNTTNKNQFLTFVAGTGTTTGFGVSTTGLVFNPSTGNLGIGTTIPIQKLHVVDAIVVSSASTSLSNAIQTKAYANQYSIEDVDGFGARQYISIAKSDTDLFKVNDDLFNTRFVVGAAGSVGIGTTLPRFALDVIGFTNVTGNTNINGNLTVNNVNITGGLTWQTVGSGNTIYTLGKVGIGTSNPLQSLHVVDAIVISSASTSISNAFQTKTYANQYSIEDVDGFGARQYISIAKSDTDLFKVNDDLFNTRLVVNASGFVGIATTNSIAQLQVASGSVIVNSGPVIVGAATSTGTASQPLQVTGGSYISGNLGIGATNTSFKLQVAGGAHISGSVGLGTDIPLQKLHVVDAIVVSSAATSISNAFQTKTYANQYSIEDVDGFGARQYISINKTDTDLFKVNDDLFNTRFVVGAAGSVGIGTTNPPYIFTVTTSGASATPGLINVLGDFTANTNSYSQINTRNASSGANASSDIIVTANTGTDTTNYIDLGINNSGYSVAGWTINGALDGYLYTSDTNLSIGAAASNKYVSIFTGGTLAENERLRVNSTGVGIGTTNPTVALTVVGNSLITGITTIGIGATSTPPSNSQLSFELTSNTNLRIKVRGTDGVLRSANITLA
jgi:hypothetical protein